MTPIAGDDPAARSHPSDLEDMREEQRPLLNYRWGLAGCTPQPFAPVCQRPADRQPVTRTAPSYSAAYQGSERLEIWTTPPVCGASMNSSLPM